MGGPIPGVAPKRASSERPYVLPTETDEVARGALPLLGGPVGLHAQLGRSWWRPIRVCLLLGMATYAVGWLSKGYCLTHGWADPQRYMYLCYSDIPALYGARGIADGVFPYLIAPGEGQQVLEYPVLTGVAMHLSGIVTRAIDDDHATFFAVTICLMAALLAWGIASTSRTVPRRPWDGLLLAMAPAVALAGFINWDLLAVALTSAFLLAWSRRRPAVAGVWLGLAAAAKFYPVVLLGPLAVLCLRRGRLRDLGILVAASLSTWLAVNLPVLFANPAGWARFYEFSRERGMDFGSPWYALSLLGVEIPARTVNALALGSFLAACLAIAALGMWAPRPPRLASLALLTVGALVLTNKVYSPQYVLWVLPLAILARPRWRDLLVWQAGEAAYFVGIWWYLVGFRTDDQGLPYGWYVAATAAHWLATAWLMGVVVRDALRPELDPVRADDDADDPGGGVLDGAGHPELVVSPATSRSDGAQAVPAGLGEVSRGSRRPGRS